MTKIYIKLIAMALALILSVSVVIMSSYAWLVLSGNPVATGIQVVIGGGNTILTAPNIEEVDEDGTVYCYPGYFSDRLNFGQQSNYAYLQELGNLTPVSTSNGVDWFLPAYYSGNDEEVQEGKIPSGALKDISEFQIDSELTYANLTSDETDKISKGSYVYLDFWVVSPGGDYTLRISTGDDTTDGGSFVIDLLEPELSGDSYVLGEPDGSAAAAVRVGFLANDLTLIDDTMRRYEKSKYFDERFTSLKGMYQEPDTGTAYLDANRFTIYEPNGDYHPSVSALDGTYVETRPLALVDRQIVETRTKGSLTVQRNSTWAPAESDSASTAIGQRFKTALYARIWDNMATDQIMERFYGNYLQGQISSYVDKGSFVSNMSNLYSLLGENDSLERQVDLSDSEHLGTSGATDDVYIIKLERNVPQRIRMFVWLEGQDIDCSDSVNSARFAVNIELAGGSE